MLGWWQPLPGSGDWLSCEAESVPKAWRRIQRRDSGSCCPAAPQGQSCGGRQAELEPSDLLSWSGRKEPVATHACAVIPCYTFVPPYMFIPLHATLPSHAEIPPYIARSSYRNIPSCIVTTYSHTNHTVIHRSARHAIHLCFGDL